MRTLIATLIGAAVGVTWGFSTHGMPTGTEDLIGSGLGYSFIPGVVGMCVGKRLSRSTNGEPVPQSFA